MVAACPGANIRVIEGSDHGISEFADYVDDVLAFCGYGPGGKVPAAQARHERAVRAPLRLEPAPGL